MNIALMTAVLLSIAPSPKTAGAQTAAGRLAAPVPYRWKSVQMVGGGFVDGIVFHPTARGGTLLPYRHGRRLPLGRPIEAVEAAIGLGQL